MSNSSNQLRLFGLIQDLQREAVALGLHRTAAALEVTTSVAMEELSDVAPVRRADPTTTDEDAER